MVFLRLKWAIFGVLVALVGCTNSPQKTEVELSPISPGTGFILTTSLFYTTSSLATFRDNPNALTDNLLVESGDAVLAPLTNLLGILNRGIESNIHLIGEKGQAGKQIALPQCSPHDALSLPDNSIVISCYDSPFLEVLSSKGTLIRSIDLAAFADEDGIPELDHMALVGNRLVVSAQLLDRADQFASTRNGILIILDSTTLDVVDTDANTPGLQGLELPCWDPYTRLYPNSSGEIVLACVSSFTQTEHAKIIKVDPVTGETSVIADYDSLGGFPSDLVLDSEENPVVIVYTT